MSDWYHALPAGLDTEIFGRGDNLAAGEAQLIALARIFLRDPQLVILDEASSRLDPATEHLIEQAIDKLLTERTAIIIAHRLSTITRVDEILILDSGHIREYGQYNVLAKNPSSYFASLLKAGLENVQV